MEPPLLLHVGMPKTGTSAVKSFCVRYQDVLLANGWVLVDVPRGGLDATTLAQTRAAIDRVIADGRRAIHVAENLYRVPDRVQAAFGGLSMAAALVLRRQDDFIESFFKEHVKKGMTTELLSQFLRRPSMRGLHFDRLVRQWSAVVGEGRLRAVSYSRRGPETAYPVNFMARQLGVQVPAEHVRRRPERNSSLSVPEAVLFLAARRSGLLRGPGTDGRNDARDLYLRLGGRTRSPERQRILSLDDRVAVLAPFAPGNRRLSLEGDMHALTADPRDDDADGVGLATFDAAVRRLEHRFEVDTGLRTALSVVDLQRLNHELAIVGEQLADRSAPCS